jgi:multidrug efflux system outer membrane protein
MKSFLFLFPLSAAALSAALPTVGPDYVRPAIASPAAYRDGSTVTEWKLAVPADQRGRGEWWQIFGDPELNRLERRALAANQDLSAAAARVEQANATARVTRAQQYPQAAVAGGVTRERQSTAIADAFPQAVFTDYSLPLVASWELDLFGRVRRLNEGARADAAAAQALFESVQLALTANVAETYFALGGLDRETAVVDQTIGLRQRELKLIAARRQLGSATELDTARAETELATVQVEAEDLAVRRNALQDALAILTGEAATSFAVASTRLPDAPPEIPSGMPSDLLERRPDVAAAERSSAAANAQIGVAKAAFFPTISLTGAGGVESASTAHLFSTDARVWSFGPSLYLPVFQGGRNRANLERSKAAYAENVALFRERILTAVAEVQTALTATRHLAIETEAQQRALSAAQRSAELAQKRYDAGYVSYLEVIDAQRTALATERASVQLQATRLTNSVSLIKALGGAWVTGG